MNDNTLRVGEISFTNCLNIFHYLKTRYRPQGVSYHQGPPAVLNCMLRDGQLDLSISSSIEYARDSANYLVLPGLGIGSRGALPSIRLFSRIPLDRLDGRRVGLTAESATTVTLCRVILEHFLGYHNAYLTIGSTLERGLEQCDAMVLIGDKALEADTRGVSEDLFSYDLSILWEQHTGLPFVFALWILRKDSAERLGAQMHGFWEALNSAHGDMEQPDDELIAGVLESRRYLDRESLLAYWDTIAYRLSARHMDGLRLFYSLAERTGLIESEPVLEIYDPSRNYSPA